MRRLTFLLLLLLASCTTDHPTVIPNTVQTQIGDAHSAVINLNIFNRDATIQALEFDSSLLFSANVDDVNTVIYTENLNEQAFLALSDDPNQVSSAAWIIETNPSIPMSYVVDVIGATLAANLASLDLARFDIVTSDSTVDIQFPTSPFQLAVDSNASTFNMNIPINAQIQSAQLLSNGGLMTISIESDVNLLANVSVTSGGMTINVPTTTGVQIIVDSTTNSEITLPDSPRIAADATIYTTANFETSTSKILVNATLNSAAIRIVQE